MQWSKTPFGKAILWTIITVELLFVSVVIGLWALPGVAPPIFAVVGGSVCPVADLFGCIRFRTTYFEEIEHIRKKTKLIKTDPEGFELWETPHGSWWVPARSGGSLPSLLAQQIADFYGDGAHTVQPGDIALDGGAHIGLWVREALDRGAKTVVAIEPAPANVECLRRNLSNEIHQGRVVVYPKGIWDVPDELPLWEDPDNSAADGFLLRNEDSEVHHVIPLVPIDQLVQELNLDRVDVIKMDIKGAVERALQGAQSTLLQDHPKLIIAADEQEADNPIRIKNLVEQLAPGYELTCVGCQVLHDWSISPDVMLMGYSH